jgi:cation diffusion facilitator CzcD-associated flavoprotein CzcO
MPDTLDVDYLVVGGGATGLAFTDALVAESPATVLIVDRRHAPGGHWNDAYPFVRLHQASAFYGVNSRSLGEDRIDESGPDAGTYERATGAEICHYFQGVLHDRLLASGQVEFLGMTDCTWDEQGRARAVSLLTGVARDINVRRKIVDARFLQSAIPATHTPSFEVDDGVRLVPVNGLVRTEHPADGYVVIGAGKTGMDACNWLLDNGVDPDDISWIKPRDAWVIDRATLQPREKVGSFIINWAAAVEASAAATSVAGLFGRLEESGLLWRIDASIQPTMYRLATLNRTELDQLHSIERIVRKGRVRRIGTDRILLDDGDVATTPDRLYVDCTADGIPTPTPRPIFAAGRITIQAIREGSPPFNAALIGYVEATRDDVAEQNALAPTNAYPSTDVDWIRTRHVGMIAQRTWNATPDVQEWMEASRLNIAAGLVNHAAEPGVAQAIGSYLERADEAIANLGVLRAELGDQVTEG